MRGESFRHAIREFKQTTRATKTFPIKRFIEENNGCASAFYMLMTLCISLLSSAKQQLNGQVVRILENMNHDG